MNISGLPELRNRIASYAEKLRNLRPAYLRAGVVVLTAAQERIRDNGPGWQPAAFDVGKGSLLQRTGALFRSLTIGGEGNINVELPDGIRVGTNLRTPDDKYDIGTLMQYGTGVYGPTGQPIRPTSGKALMITLADGSVIFRKSVKGSPPRPFLFIDDDTAQKVTSVFATYVREA